MDLTQGTRPEQRILTVKLAEGKTGQLQFGAGYSSVDKAVGFFSITKRNFDPFDLWSFTGAGQEISASAEFGGTKQSYSLSWTEPWWRNRPLSVGFDVFNLYQEREGFDWRRRGGAIRLSHKYGEYGRLSYKYGIEEAEILKVTASAPQDVRTEVGFPGTNRFVRRTASLTTGYSHDTRDENLFPTSGHFFEISNQLAGRFLGGNVSFTRPVVNYNHYRRGLSQNHVIAFRGQYGTISNFFEKGNPIPTAEKFYLGGVNTVRGYRDRSIQVYATDNTLLGPGSSYMLGNIEYRIPFTDDKSFSLAFFYDVGSVSNGEFTFGLKNLASGIGTGVRFQTPLGPIRLDYGYGLDFPNKNRGQIHFSIGQMF
jgi:outer membrane protein insertion porin family